MSTGSSKPTLSVGGFSATVSNNNAGKIQTKSKGFSLNLGVVAVKWRNTRYWSDETYNVASYGSLYMGGVAAPNFDEKAFDTYESTDARLALSPYHFHEIHAESNPDFDSYSVTAQGLGGSFRPYQYRGYLVGQTIKKNDGSALEKYFVPSMYSTVPNINPSFRFVNDFSNSFRQNMTPFYSTLTTVKNTAAPFDASPVYGDNDGTFGFNASTESLAGSKSIHYVLNSFPASGNTSWRGFIRPSNCNGFVRPTDNNMINQIGGFVITNESGVTYHYGLPVYSMNEEVFNRRISTADGYIWSNLKREVKYAYQWLLSTITGPDYVDKNQNGIADNGDWGYWVNFEYGKWADDYCWRNPAEGFHRDVDNGYENYSKGKKELYYLNAIRTRTHLALFEKDIRMDGKGSATNIFNVTLTDPNHNQGQFDGTSKSVMKLNRIYLFNVNDPAPYVSPGYGIPPASYNGHHAQNVYDRHDFEAYRSTLENMALRIIEFSHDYKLTAGTPNSFSTASPSVKLGKLTLNALSFRGKGNVCAIPPLKFEYDYSAGQAPVATGTLSSTTFSTNSPVFNVGDVLVTNDPDNIFCGIVKKKTLVDPSFGTTLYELANNEYWGSNSVRQLRATKNPKYDKHLFDFWGYYKGDLNKTTLGGADENFIRRTTPVSANATDVWSLRKVTTSLGSEIRVDYEPDSYRKIVLGSGQKIAMKTAINSVQCAFVTNNGNGTYNISFDLETYGYNVSDIFQVGDNISVMFMLTNGWGPTSNKRYPIIKLPSVPIQSISPAGRITITTNQSFESAIIANPLQNFLQGVLMGNEPCPGCQYNGFYYMGGNVISSKEREYFGGGLRVKSLSIVNPDDNTVKSTHYRYTSLMTPGASSGATSYEPTIFDDARINIDISTNRKSIYDYYKWFLYEDMNTSLNLTREIPAPGVMYEYATVVNKVKQTNAVEYTLEGSTTYQFEVFNNNMIQRKLLADQEHHNYSGMDDLISHNVTMKNSSARVGSLKRIIRFDDKGQRLSETINHYLHDQADGLAPDNFFTQYETLLQNNVRSQGVIKERYSQIHDYYTKYWTGSNWATYTQTRIKMSGREEYPVVQTGQTVVDYRTGNTTATENLAYDYYSGEPIKTLTRDGMGNAFVKETVPAYRKYTGLGLKMAVASMAKNMLTQEAASYIYKVDPTNVSTKLGLVAANVTVWNNTVPVLTPDGTEILQNSITLQNVGTPFLPIYVPVQGPDGFIWRPQFTYNWMPEGTSADGLTGLGAFTDFDWNNQYTPAAQPAGWKKTSQTTLYNVFSNPLEMQDINNTYTAQKSGYGASKLVAAASMAKYAELAFSSAEDDVVAGKFNAEVTLGNGSLNTDMNFVHTGKRSISMPNGQTGFYYEVPIAKLQQDRDYYATVWVKSSISFVPNGAGLFYSVNGGTPVQISMNGGFSSAWNLTQLRIPASALAGGGTLRVGCYNNHGNTVYFDDFRFHPLNSTVTSFVYDSKTGELTHILDKNNLFTKYEYDAVGRLVKTYREAMPTGVRLVSEHVYNYSEACELPVTVYARMKIENIQYHWDMYCNGTTADVIIKFFADEDCTIPLTVPANLLPLDINYRTDGSWLDQWGNSGYWNFDSSQPMNTSTTQFMLFQGVYLDQCCYDDPFNLNNPYCTYMSFSLNPGNYIVK
ncbi:MAG TPA: hypothetical protein VD996_07655 [Chitinophagaceae bacterium]|nr:hypothetical protein [Chitinophagaceae bacterium]